MFDAILPYLSQLPGKDQRHLPGEILFLPGEEVTKLYLIESGEVHMMRNQENGDLLILQRATGGQLLAEASLFAEAYHCSAMVVQTTHLRALHKDAVLKLMAQVPGFAMNFSAHLAAELRSTRQRAEILALKTVAQRLDAWMTFQNREDLPERGHWKELAWEIGVSPEALYRELAKRRKRAAPLSEG